MATLSRHTKAVNVVRFSPDGTHVVGLAPGRVLHVYVVPVIIAGEFLASSGDGEFFFDRYEALP